MSSQLAASPKRSSIGRSLATAVGALAVGLVSLAFPHGAAACVGGPLLEMDDPAADSYEEVAEVIFTGTVVRRDDESLGLTTSSFDPFYWTFVVDGVDKGAVGDRFTVSSPRSGGSCGVEFVLGQRYQVYAWGGDSPGRPEVSQGNGTHRLPALPNPPAVEGEFKGPALIGLLVAPLTNPALGGVLLVAAAGTWWFLANGRGRSWVGGGRSG